jgi:hypothetical protein
MIDRGVAGWRKGQGRRLASGVLLTRSTATCFLLTLQELVQVMSRPANYIPAKSLRSRCMRQGGAVGWREA